MKSIRIQEGLLLIIIVSIVGVISCSKTKEKRPAIIEETRLLLNNAGYDLNHSKTIYYDSTTVVAFQRVDFFPYWVEAYYILNSRPCFSRK